MGKFFNLHLQNINYKIRRPTIEKTVVPEPEPEKAPLYIKDADKVVVEAER